MSLHELDRKQLIVPVNIVAGADLAAADTPGVIANMVVPQNCLVVGISASYQSAGGTTPSTITFDLRRSTTVLATAAVAAAATPVRTSPLNVRLNAGETVNINTSNLVNTDNTFAGVVVTLELQIVPDL